MTTEATNTGNELINATQSAVIETIENVAEMIENPDPIVAHEHEVFYLSAEFWVAVAFVLTIILLSRPIYKAVKGMIINNIDNIRNEIDEAAKLQEDAEKMLSSYERKFRNVKKEANDILKKSQTEIDYLRKASMTQLEQEMKQKEKDMADKLQTAKANAINEITNIAGDLSIKTVRKIIQNKLKDKDLSKLIDASIKKIENI